MGEVEGLLGVEIEEGEGFKGMARDKAYESRVLNPPPLYTYYL